MTITARYILDWWGRIWCLNSCHSSSMLRCSLIFLSGLGSHWKNLPKN